MPKVKMVKINGDALRAEIFKKGKTMTQASNECGCNDEYFTKVTSKGEMPKRYVPLVTSVLSINPCKYVIDATNTQKTEPKAEPVVDGKMVRNIDVEFIRFRAHEIGLPLKSFCDVMGKKDNYLSNLRVNGAKKEDVDRIAMILRIDADDDRLFLKPQALEEAKKKTVDDISTRLHKAESKIADLYNKVAELTEQNRELTRRVDGGVKVDSAIVGELAKRGIFVGKQ